MNVLFHNNFNYPVEFATMNFAEELEVNIFFYLDVDISRTSFERDKMSKNDGSGKSLYEYFFDRAS